MSKVTSKFVNKHDKKTFETKVEKAKNNVTSLVIAYQYKNYRQK